MRHDVRGFTLIELIIGLSLTALIMTLVGSAVFGLGDGSRRVTERAQEMHRIFRVSQAIRGAIGKMNAGAFQRVSALMEGDAETIRWWAPMPDSAPVAGVMQWRLYVETGHLNLALTDHQSEPVMVPKVLLEGLSSFRVQYQSHDGTWFDAWSGPKPPLRVRLQITTVTDGVWPPIAIRLEDS